MVYVIPVLDTHNNRRQRTWRYLQGGVYYSDGFNEATKARRINTYCSAGRQSDEVFLNPPPLNDRKILLREPRLSGVTGNDARWEVLRHEYHYECEYIYYSTVLNTLAKRNSIRNNYRQSVVVYCHRSGNTDLKPIDFELFFRAHSLIRTIQMTYNISEFYTRERKKYMNCNNIAETSRMYTTKIIIPLNNKQGKILYKYNKRKNLNNK